MKKEMELNKALAEIAISGLLEGMIDEAESIINMLEAESVSDISKLSLRSLLFIYSDNIKSAIDLLEPWCEEHSDQLDTPHSYLALALWRSGRVEEAEKLCRRLIESSADCASKKLAREICTQIGE
ncbi:tetratricopeptide repeat protein [Microbulbifer sp. EKSA005]|uniref:tetratricopeptide repeat protein n=1 Tax=Microbulbifer sp. EKSA005 TaxID=3243364 RepID=UPI0040430EA4